MTRTGRPPRARIRHVRFSDLAPHEANRRIDALVRVVAESMTPGVAADASWAAKDFDSRRTVLIDTADAYEATVDGRIVGFVVFRIEELSRRPTIHLMAGCICPSHQASGLASTMTARIVLRAMASRPGSPVYVAGHVVNPVALAGWVKRVGAPRPVSVLRRSAAPQRRAGCRRSDVRQPQQRRARVRSGDRSDRRQTPAR